MSEDAQTRAVSEALAQQLASLYHNDPLLTIINDRWLRLADFVQDRIYFAVEDALADVAGRRLAEVVEADEATARMFLIAQDLRNLVVRLEVENEGMRAQLREQDEQLRDPGRWP